MTAVTAAAPGRRRRWPRRLGWGLLVAALLYGVGCGLGMQPSVPFDLVINLGSFDERPGLRAAPATVEHVVVLQHGLWRSPFALWKLERALRAHGYRVLNPAYPSTRGTIGQHAGRLAAAVAGAAPAAGERRWYFVGHSMGGLVIQEYLRRSDAVRPAACVFLATPHRGAVLCDLRRHWWLFRLFMGERAALQLSPGDPLHRRPIPRPCPMGTVVGAVGDGQGRNADIPGDDDGTVAVSEAHLPGEADSVSVPAGHTGIATDDAAIHQVLHFLRHARFAR